MIATLPILEAIQERIYQQVPHFAVELFPDNPDEYRLNAEDGAILIQYLGSQFGDSQSTTLVQQRRVLDIVLTVLARSQHNEQGALNTLDLLRAAVMGFAPNQCSPIYFVKEEWLGSESGIWQYQLVVRTYTHELQQQTAKDLPKYVTSVLKRHIKEK